MTEPLMDVLVDGRSTGKTTLLLDWLHAGHEIKEYPGWSRLLVCTRALRVPLVAMDAMDRFGDGPWVKCVFSVRDLQLVFRGAIKRGTVEYAVDDAEQLIASHLAVPQAPTLVAINGTAPYQ